MQLLAYHWEKALKAASPCSAVSHTSAAPASGCYAQGNWGNKGLKPQPLIVLASLFLSSKHLETASEWAGALT